MFRKGMQQMAVLAFTLVLTATAPAVAAGAPHSKSAAAHEGSFVTRAWQWVQSLWAEQGACIDPNGKCTNTATPPPVHTDQGACIDPDGRCAASLQRP